MTGLRRHKRPGLLAVLVLSLPLVFSAGQGGFAAGVPVKDYVKTLQERLKLLEEGFKREEQIEKSAKNAEKNDLHDQQLDALRATIAQLTSSNPPAPSRLGGLRRRTSTRSTTTIPIRSGSLAMPGSRSNK